MSIAPMTRIALAGPAERLAAALEALQDLGTVELEPFDPAAAAAAGELAPGAAEARRALRHLARTPDPRAPRRRDPGFDAEKFIAKVRENAAAEQALEDRREFLQTRIADVEHWGEFALPDGPERIDGLRLWFYIVPLRNRAALEAWTVPWRVIGRTNTKLYVVALAEAEPDPAAAPAPRVHVGAQSLSALRAELEAVEEALDDARQTRRALTGRMGLLARRVAETEDRAERLRAAAGAYREAGLFALQGWTPTERLGELRAVADRFGLAFALPPSEPGAAPPTLLAPAAPVAAGADLAAFYRMPAASLWDPSGVFFLSFAAFFAMILSDAGYAVVLAGALALFWRAMGRSPAGRRLRRLAGAAVAASLAWGSMVGSWFGAPPPHPWLQPLARFDMTDLDGMMRVAVFVGVGHIGLAIALLAWRRRARLAALADLGWLGLLGAGTAAYAGAPADTAAIIGGVGALAVVLFSGAGPVRGPLDIVKRFAAGLLALTKAPSLFADILSYLRLFALGLASSSLALAFNDLAADALALAPGFGLVAAVLVLALGHALNLALSVVGGLVHGLRLNFMEFSNWGLPDEGRPFRPFARRAAPEGGVSRTEATA